MKDIFSKIILKIREQYISKSNESDDEHDIVNMLLHRVTPSENL